MPSILDLVDTNQQAPAATAAMQQLAAAVNAVLADDVAAAVPDL